jgi:hypothetical protein
MHIRDTVTQATSWWWGRSARCVNNDFDLWKLENCSVPKENLTYAHRAFVDEETIELGSSFVGGSWLREDDGSDATADAVWSIGEKDFLDRGDGFGKVLLYRRKSKRLVQS